MADDDTSRRESAPARAENDLGQAIHLLVAGWRVFGRYTLESRIGRGEMSVVWRAHDELLDEAVALKFVAEILAQDAVAVDDLRQKTARARLLAHPHIVRVNDFMRDNTLATVSMEYVESATLEHKRLEQPGRVFSPAALAPLILQICPALDYAHESARIVHRGLKPSNILVTPEGVAKITDFGIACSLAETRLRLTRQGDRDRGTWFRLSPQQLEGRPPSPADDIYAFGAMLYELLAGQPSFPVGESAAHLPADAPAAMAARRAESGVTGEPIPPTWEKVVAACLARDPMRRPSSGEEIICLLELAGRKPAADAPLPAPDTARAKDSSLAPLSAWTTPAPLTRGSQSPLLPKRRSLIHYLTREESEQKTTEEQILPVKAPAPVKASAPESGSTPVSASAGPVIAQAAAVEVPQAAPAPPIPPAVPAPSGQITSVEAPAPVKASAPESGSTPVSASAGPVSAQVAAVEESQAAPAPPIPPAAPAPSGQITSVEAPAPVKASAPESGSTPVSASAGPVIAQVTAVEESQAAPAPPIPPAAPAPSGPDLIAALVPQAAPPTTPTRPSEKSQRPKRSSLIHYPTPEEAEQEAEEIAAKSGTGGREERSWVSRAWTGFFRH